MKELLLEEKKSFAYNDDQGVNYYETQRILERYIDGEPYKVIEEYGPALIEELGSFNDVGVLDESEPGNFIVWDYLVSGFYHGGKMDKVKLYEKVIGEWI